MRNEMRKVLVCVCTAVLVAGVSARAHAVECTEGVKIAETCPAGMTYEGCCADGTNKVVWCGNAVGDTGPLCGINCATDPMGASECGWKSSFYGCGGSGADPSGANPLACTNWTCTPSCAGKQCGDDGCLGTCGDAAGCGEGKFCDAQQQCQTCSCGAKQCGTDECGGFCGTLEGACAEGQYCDENQMCQACSCNGKVCGADECDRACGGPCAAGTGCLDGQCVAVPAHCEETGAVGCPGCPCEACVCGMDSLCCDASNGWDYYCVMECQYYCGGDPCPCEGDCAGKECGNDGCGGTCGTCADPNAVCTSDGTCCIPDCTGKQCGTDGCGGTCGDPAGCGEGKYCDAQQQCQACSCGDKTCGYDQCYNACGANDGGCAEGSYCDDTDHCQVCTCAGKVCGGDGCGVACGTCTGGKGCLDGQCVDVPASCILTYEPGCNGCACETCVCQGDGGTWEGDSYCCDPDYGWDSWCADECHKYCGGPVCPCVPDCTDKECGSDGCEGACGTCASGTFCNADSMCETCTCTGKECGEDGCGNKCGDNGGDCPAGKVCTTENTCVDDPCKGFTYEGCCDGTLAKWCENGQIVSTDCGTAPCGWAGSYYYCGSTGTDPNGLPIDCPACTKECTGKDCGPDGCGGSCGTCAEGSFCGDDGKCGTGYPAVCLGEGAPSAATCGENSTYEGCCDSAGRVVWCDQGALYCLDCAAQQSTCGWGAQQAFYLCGGTDTPPAQFPIDCKGTGCIPACNGAVCGDGGCPDKPDACGTCAAGTKCDAGQCVACTVDCAGKQCGDDGCNGTCGTCEAGKECKDGICEVPCTPSCLGKQCGSDGCKGVCGTCAAGKTCDPNGLCIDECVADCAGKQCGPDGCNGSCGTCAAGKTCEAGLCVTTPTEGVVQDVPVTDKPATEGATDTVSDHGTTTETGGTGGSGGGSCNAGMGGQALPFALLLSSLGMALLRRRR